MEEQNNALEEQKVKQNQLEDAENQRKTEEKNKENEQLRLQREIKKQQLKIEYDNAVTTLRVEKEKIAEIERFKLLRSAYAKQEELRQQYIVIRNWENEVERLESELKNY
ncbi:MAG: hypothetical protein SGJ10_03590 [Bacteroidota bacterium]|nr:hypothetical protein [Bacteroidota bacterium]